jgi:uncharacterized protein (TIGR00730 family)
MFEDRQYIDPINPNRIDSDQDEEKYFLEGPRSRWKEFKFTVSVLLEFIKGFRALHFVGPCATVFGSARFKEQHPYYQLARQVGASLANMGFTVMTGGGPGVMEAANRGAKEVGGKSVGCNIVLPMEQHENPYLDTWVDIKYFFVRKVLLSKYSYAFIVLPGGMGTLDELFEAVTLIQTNKIKKFPIVLFDKAYHKNLYEHVLLMAKAGTISPEDIDLILFTDSIEEAMTHIKKYSIEKFGLKKKKRTQAWGWLGEKSRAEH